jgi:hypothetical protein
MKTGRNAPCPCGSGKKHKHCCLNASVAAAEPPELLVWRRIRRALDDFDFARVMLAFVKEVYGPPAIHEAWAEFHLWADEEEPDFDPRSPFIPVFMPWFFHRWTPDVDTEIEGESLLDRSPTAEFLHRRRRRIEPVLQRYLQACLESPFSFHEILDSEPGRAFRARDVLTGEERRVLERSASEPMQRGDILFAQLVDVDDIVMMEAGSPVLLPPIDKIDVMQLRNLVAMQPEVVSPRQLLLELDSEMREVYLPLARRILEPVPPEFRNTEGDLIAPHRIVFEIDSPSSAFHALKHLSLTESEEELLASADLDANGAVERVSITWSQPGNAMHPSWENTLLGTLEIRGNQLIGGVNSAERAARLRRLVEEALGARARHRATEIQSIESLPEADDVSPEPRLGALDPEDDLAELPEVKARIREVMAAHYEDWVTSKIPALGDRTPLEAVAAPEGREKVEALIAQFERREDPTTLDPAIIHRLRERLGLVPAAD